jgi:nicotinamidase-related amidase
MSKTALVVIDLQNEYFPGGKCTLVGTDAAADNAAKLVADFRAMGSRATLSRFQATDRRRR